MVRMRTTDEFEAAQLRLRDNPAHARLESGMDSGDADLLVSSEGFPMCRV